jgi:hypothetical protein
MEDICTPLVELISIAPIQIWDTPPMVQQQIGKDGYDPSPVVVSYLCEQVIALYRSRDNDKQACTTCCGKWCLRHVRGIHNG